MLWYVHYFIVCVYETVVFQGWPVPQVFVIDSADQDRLEEVNSEMTKLLTEEDKLAGVPLLVYANKQDLLSAMSAEDIATGLNLTGIKDRSWQIQACSAKTGEGLSEGMEWLVSTIQEREAEAEKK